LTDRFRRFVRVEAGRAGWAPLVLVDFPGGLVGYRSRDVRLGAASANSFAGLAGCGEQEPGGGVGRVVLGGREDDGVGIGGEHDAGVQELVLDGLEVGASGLGEAGGAVAQIVEADRRSPARLASFRNRWVTEFGRSAVPSRRVNT